MSKVPAMFHPKPSEVSSLKPPKVPFKFKYLQRALHLNENQRQSLIKLNIKRIHIRKINELFIDDKNERIELARIQKKYLKKKLFKNLTDLEMYSFYDRYWIEDLKNSKKLTNFIFNPYQECSNPMILKSFFTRLTKYLKGLEVILEPDLNISYSNIRKLYRVIGSLSKLRTYHGENEGENSTAKEEFICLYKYLNRLHYLQDFECNFPKEGQTSLVSLNGEKKMLPKVTRLTMHLDAFDQIPQNFHFDCFPHLKKLELEGIENFSNLNSSLLQSFQSLSSLENLHIKLASAATNPKNLFVAFLQLPQLSSFSLNIDGLIETAWKSLTRFIQGQTSLISMKLEIERLNPRNANLSQVPCFEDFLASLSHKPKLKYLFITCDYFPLPNLSQGLKGLVGTEQLRSFLLEATENLFSTSLPLENPLQGLCEFLLRNKKELRELKLCLPLFREQELNQEIAATISQLSQLKNFEYSLSSFSLAEFGHRNLKFLNGRRNYNNGKKVWDPCLHQILPKLQNLESLALDFALCEKCPQEDRRWISRSFKILPSLKNLRKFHFIVPRIGLSKTEATNINSVLEKLVHLNSLELLEFEDKIVDGQFEKIMDKVESLKLRQVLRVNFSF